jgi:tetratricopeptide (TPR) repeat protein
VANCVPGRTIAISPYDEAGFRSATVDRKTLKVGVENREGFKAGLNALAAAFPGIEFSKANLPRGEMAAALERNVIDVTPYPCDLVLANQSDFFGRFDRLHSWLLSIEGVPPPPPALPSAELSEEINAMEFELEEIEGQIARLQKLTEAGAFSVAADDAYASDDSETGDALLDRALAIYTESCKDGDSEACFRVGDLIWSWDETGAAEFYQRACDMGHSVACAQITMPLASTTAQSEITGRNCLDGSRPPDEIIAECSVLIEAFEAAGVIGGTASLAMVKRGQAHLQQQSYNQALLDFSAAINQDPARVSAYTGRAATYRQMGLIDEAIADYETVRDSALAPSKMRETAGDIVELLREAH